MTDFSSDRRTFFTHGIRRLLDHALDAVSERVAPMNYVRPPGALPEAAFVAACTRCGECEKVCPAYAISMLGAAHGLASGTPILDLDRKACEMCPDMPCAKACPTDALNVPETGWIGVKLSVISIDPNACIGYRGVKCGICARWCPAGEEALKMVDGRPVLGPACTGCGTCVYTCVTTPSSISAAAIGRNDE